MNWQGNEIERALSFQTPRPACSRKHAFLCCLQLQEQTKSSLPRKRIGNRVYAARNERCTKKRPLLQTQNSPAVLSDCSDVKTSIPEWP